MASAPLRPAALEWAALVCLLVSVRDARAHPVPRQAHAEMGTPFALAVLATGAARRWRWGRAGAWDAPLRLLELQRAATPRQRLVALARLLATNVPLLLSAAQMVAGWGLAEWALTYAQRYASWALALPDAWLKDAGSGALRVPWTPHAAYEAAQWRSRLDALAKRGGHEGRAFERYNRVSSGARGATYVSCWPHRGEADLPREEPIAVVLDMTNEVPEHPSLTAAPSPANGNRQYVSFPVWDQGLPQRREQFVATVRRVACVPGNVLVHCIAGVGRSTMTAALVMLARGDVATVEEAYAQIRKARPLVRWRPDQRAFVDEIAPRVAGCAAAKRE